MVNGVGMSKANTADGGGRKNCSRLELEISPERIHFLKFILEGYDGMAVLTTVDAVKGLVLLRFPAEVENDIEDLLSKIKPQIAKTI